jgi:hypothetical protein
LTNNFALPALTITQLYRCRWQIELFYKWIKQYRSLPWHHREHRQDPLHRSLSLRFDRHRQKATRYIGSLYEVLQILRAQLFSRELHLFNDLLKPTHTQNSTTSQTNQIYSTNVGTLLVGTKKL